MNKILKRLLTGVLTLATVFTALPTTAVHAAETQYWTESEERVGIVEKVMNDGSIGSTFNEGHMTVEGEDAYCIDINTGFKNGYKTRSDASTRMTAYQIEDVALSLEWDETLNRRALKLPKSIEEQMIEAERAELLCKAVDRLPEIQRRRFLLYYEYEFNFYQIAAMEHCTASAIQKSVAVAKKKVKAEMRKYLQP